MAMSAYKFDFADTPDTGTEVNYFGHVLTLVGVEPYKRKDGTDSVLLKWSSPDGRIGSSGLRSRAITWAKQ